ncbi:MAG: hypothetical protein IPL10_05390 [Bacteroidetes bacterium]|nr:hypothetical protein [Bacteroidota bacterium]
MVDVPMGSFGTPGDATTVVQPDYQTTSGGQFCAVTGNAPVHYIGHWNQRCGWW